MGIFRAFFFRDLAIERSYRFQLLLRAGNVLFQLAIFFFIGRLVGADYFSFVFVGLLFGRFFEFWLNIFTENIRQEQYWGTAEIVFLSPARPFAVTLASASGKLASLAIELLAYVLIGRYVFGAAFILSPALAVPVILNTVAFASLGMIAGSFILYFKRGDPVAWFVATSFELLSGVYFPLAVLPQWLQGLAKVLPTTSALEAWRAAMLTGRLPSLGNIVVQAGWSVGLAIVAVAVFRTAFSRARIKGELGSY